MCHMSSNQETPKATQHNATHPRQSLFSELPQVGLEPVTVYVLHVGRVVHVCTCIYLLYQLSYQGSSAGWVESHIQRNTSQGKVCQPEYQENSNIVYRRRQGLIKPPKMQNFRYTRTLCCLSGLCAVLLVLFWVLCLILSGFLPILSK